MQILNAIGAKWIWVSLSESKDTGRAVGMKTIWVPLLELCRYRQCHCEKRTMDATVGTLNIECNSVGIKRIFESLMETKDTCNAIGAKSIWTPLLEDKR